MASFSAASAGDQADVLLVITTSAEMTALMAAHQERVNQPVTPIFIDDKTYFNLGTIGGARVFVVRSEMGTSSLGASLQTVTAGISALHPAAVVMLGIAFGIRQRQDQQLGDILVTSQLRLVEPQRLGQNAAGQPEIRLRGARPAASSRLLDRFRAGMITWDGAPVHVGLLLSGEKLIDDPLVLAALLAHEPEAIGGEMEGAGLYAAAQQHNVAWILVKAISDWADGTKQHNKRENQATAARNAADFVLHVIAQGGFAPQRPTATSSQSQPVELFEALATRVNLEELRTLCFDLRIDFDNLGGEGRDAKVRELILYLRRRDQLQRLTDWLRRRRPDIPLAAPER